MGVGYQQRAFDEHAVGGEQGDELVGRRAWNALFHIQFAVPLSAGIEELLQGHSSAGNPLTQFLGRWGSLDNVSGGYFDVVVGEPFGRFPAGAARRVLKKQSFHLGLFKMRYGG